MKVTFKKRKKNPEPTNVVSGLKYSHLGKTFSRPFNQMRRNSKTMYLYENENEIS